MNFERWQQIEALYTGARERQPDDRAAFLAEVCGDDVELLREVESLLSFEPRAVDFMEAPGVPLIEASQLNRDRFLIGATVGHYEILALVGVGGMGEVWRAHDTKLGRDVAIKVLPPEFAQNSERMARFQREARVLASLNHPNIAAIYDLLEDRAIAMELVEGLNLAERMRDGPMAIDEALGIAKQIAEALEAAHQTGIVHRDLKPANIMVTPDGKVKVLDFGIAKQTVASRAPLVDMHKPILVADFTHAGAILGTAAYMAPEQASGKPVDWRVDIWAFGAVLFEMVTGQLPFPGKSVAEVLAGVFTTEPALEIAPAKVQPLIYRCLRKDPRKRWQSMGDVRLAIEEGPVALTAAPRRRSEKTAWIVATALFVALAALGIYYARQVTPELQAVRLSIPIPGGSGPDVVFELSPNGQQLAITAVQDGKRNLWVRPIDSLEARLLSGTEGATDPFWSPDGLEIGFRANGKLKKVPIAGGPPTTLVENIGNASGATWSPEGLIVFASNRGLHNLHDGGGTSAPLLVPKANEAFSNPQLLPGGHRFLYVQQYGENPGIYVSDLDGMAPIRILPDLSRAVYVPPTLGGVEGYLLFRRDGPLMAQRFNPVSLTLSGSANRVTESLINKPNLGPSVLFSTSDSGTLAYQTDWAEQLIWVNRAGAFQEPLGPPGEYRDFRLSPDQSRIAMDITRFGSNASSARDVATFDLKRGVLERLTSHESADLVPVWSPDGERIVFSSNRRGAFDPYATSAANQEEILADMEPLGGWPIDWSADGQFVIWQSGGNSDPDLWIVPTSGAQQPFPYLNSRFGERGGVFSPDGRWIAYSSDESGREDVYMQSFPATGGRRYPVSDAGGSGPAWRADGREVFYVAADGKLTAVPVVLGKTSIEFGRPQTLFSAPVGTFRRNYEVSKDGMRFLIAGPAQAGGAGITVLLNWQSLLTQ